MRQPTFQAGRPITLVLFCLGLLMCLGEARGDQVEMVNGDHYVGRVVSLGSDTLVIENEFLGTLKVPRSKVATVSFESGVSKLSTNAVRSLPSLRSNKVARVQTKVPASATPDFSSAMHELGTNSSVVQQVQQQLLTGAGPEAQTKFNDLVSGLMSGKIGVNELRTEARTTLEQAKNARKELGEEGGSSLDSYLAILESFLKETEPAVAPSNSVPVSKPVLTRPSQAKEDE